MTAEGEQQEAVCGMCGERILQDPAASAVWLHTSGRPKDRHYAYPRRPTPAPVVPSDERCSTCDRREREDCPQCEFDIHREAPGIGACQKHHPFSYPPTPSQDAESVRNDSDRPQRSLSQDAEGDTSERFPEAYDAAEQHVEYMSRALDGIDLSPASFSALALDAAIPIIESAIRETYEALVRAARDAQSALVLLTSELSGQMGYIEGLQQRPHGQAQRVINSGHEAHAFLTAALARVEESLGGRKDG